LAKNYEFIEVTEADEQAKILIYLLENNFIGKDHATESA
jgi:hypothetical protein